MTNDLMHKREVSVGVLARASMPFQDFLDAIPAGAVAVDGQGEIAALNEELLDQFGYRADELLGERIELLIPSPLRGDHIGHRSGLVENHHARVMGAGEILHGQRKDGSIFPVEVGLRALPFEGDFVLAIVSDRSDQARAVASEAHEEVLAHELKHQQVVAREMGHRVKNLLAAVTALITLSARGATSPKAMEESLRGRLIALSSVIDLSLRSPSDPASGTLSIEEVLRAVLSPFMWTSVEADKISLTGPCLVVGARPAEVLALVFHELSTNALKYGSFRHPDGRVDVTWELIEDQVVLTWQERAIQFVAATPSVPGFGMTLMRRLIEMEFRGRTERQVTDLGWTTRITVPLSVLGISPAKL